jgi:hypothetical protein
MRSSLWWGGAVLEHGNLFKGGAATLSDSQNGDIIVLSFPHFSLIMMRIGAEDQELE